MHIKACGFSGKADQDSMQWTSVSMQHMNIQASKTTDNENKYKMLSEEKV